MPSIGLGRNLVHQFGMDHHNTENRCDCCPYGYHIDLDFVPFTKKMLSREGDFERLKELKDKWRSERQSMDKLLGVENIAPKIWDVNATISRASTDIWQSSKKAWEYELSKENILKKEDSDGASTEHIFENGLSEAVTDFEEALLRTRPQSKILSYEIPDSQKFHTFPRIKAPVLRDPVTGISNLNTANSIFSHKGSSSTNSTVSTVIMRDSSTKTLSSREINKKSADSLHGMESGEMESIYSRSIRSAHPEQHRDRGLGDRLFDLEEQVKLIPELEVKLTLLKEEKRQLMKLLEIEKQKSKSMVNVNSKFSSERGNINGEDSRRGPTPPRRDYAEEIPPVPPRRRTRDASVGRTILTRDVGVSHVSPRTRSIGVGGNSDLSIWDRSSRGDSTSPTGSSTTGTLKRRIKTFDAGIQVKEYEFMDSEYHRAPVLQITEGIEFGVQVGPGLKEPSPEKVIPTVRKRHTGIQAKPSTTDIGIAYKPSSRDIGSTAVEPSVPETKVRVKHVGISACLNISENPLTREKSPFRSSRGIAVAVNTDKLRTSTVACNTSSIGKLNVSSTSTQTRLESPSMELSNIENKKHEPKSSKSLFTLPVSASTSTSSLRPGQQVLSPGEVPRGPSKIPRLTSPIVSPVASPKPPTRNVPSPTNSDRSESPSFFSSSGSGFNSCPVETMGAAQVSSLLRKPSYQRSDTYTKDMYLPDRQGFGILEPLEEEDRDPRSSSASSSSGFPPAERREKSSPSKEMQAALKVLNDALLRGKTTQQVTNAISIILHEWFRVAGTKTANPFEVEDYLDSFEIYSPQLLRYIVNMPDGNGNTALHYAVSHGNFDVVSILLDSKVCDPNKANKAGYTSIMLVALAKIGCEAHRQVVRRLFSSGDVNIKAAQHGQTALMLGASHGRFDTIRLLLEAGADINIQDEDGSTALMCAAEHGHVKLVKYLLSHPDCDLHLTDNDGSTAFSIAMEGGYKDIGVLLYAQMHFSTTGEAGTPTAHKSRSTTPSSQNSTASSSAQTSPLAAKRQHSDSTLLSMNK